MLLCPERHTSTGRMSRPRSLPEHGKAQRDTVFTISQHYTFQRFLRQAEARRGIAGIQDRIGSRKRPFWIASHPESAVRRSGPAGGNATPLIVDRQANQRRPLSGARSTTGKCDGIVARKAGRDPLYDSLAGAMPSHPRASLSLSVALIRIPRLSATVSPNLPGSSTGGLRTYANMVVGETPRSL